jgi:hypothetical protein
MPPPFPLPATSAAVQEAAELVRWAWIQSAESAAMSPADQQHYIAGLESPRSVVHPFQGDPLQARVENVAPRASRLEEGYPAYHLPERINWGAARGARRSKAGRWYMFIPFAHLSYRGRKGSSQAQARMMSSAVYRVARTLQPGQRLTAGPTRGRAIHAPGLRPYVPAFQRNIRPGYTHAAKQESLVRRPGRGGGSRYLTFRTLTQDSQGWWIPAKPGVHLAPQVERATASAVRAIIEAGVRQDVEAALTRQVGGAR